MKTKTRMPPCHESLRPLYERAVREGRIAPPEAVYERLKAAQERWLAEEGRSRGPGSAAEDAAVGRLSVSVALGPPKTVSALEDLLRRYCLSAGVVELTAHARKVNGGITVEITESR